MVRRLGGFLEVSILREGLCYLWNGSSRLAGVTLEFSWVDMTWLLARARALFRL